MNVVLWGWARCSMRILNHIYCVCTVVLGEGNESNCVDSTNFGAAGFGVAGVAE